MRSGAVPPAKRLVVFDFDGTVAVGDAPVEAYLEAVLAIAPHGGGGARADLDAHLRGEDAAIDGYALITGIAGRLGLTAAQRSDAYTAARDALHDGRVEVAAPAGLAEALDRRPDGVATALVTNAPAAGIERVLERIGLAGRFDTIVGDAGKPDGLPAIVDRLRGPLPADRLLAVGDIWVNDLEPVAALGASTAAIDRHDRRDGAPTFRAPTLTALLPAIEGWWAA